MYKTLRARHAWIFLLAALLFCFASCTAIPSKTSSKNPLSFVVSASPFCCVDCGLFGWSRISTCMKPLQQILRLSITFKFDWSMGLSERKSARNQLLLLPFFFKYRMGFSSKNLPSNSGNTWTDYHQVWRKTYEHSLVGGLLAMFHFPQNWEFHHPSAQLTKSYFSEGWPKTTKQMNIPFGSYLFQISKTHNTLRASPVAKFQEKFYKEHKATWPSAPVGFFMVILIGIPKSLWVSIIKNGAHVWMILGTIHFRTPPSRVVCFLGGMIITIL